MPPPRLSVLLPPRATPRLAWAADELLARLRLPWSAGLAGGDDRTFVLALHTPLPKGHVGLEVVPPADDRPADLARYLVSPDGSRRSTPAPGRSTYAAAFDAAYEDWLGQRYIVEHPQAADRLGRPPVSATEPANSQGVCAPVADLLAEDLLAAMTATAARGGLALPDRRPPWPNGCTMAVHLSHDVDVLSGRNQLWCRYGWWSAQAALSLMRLKPRQAAVHAAKIRRFMRSSDDPHYTIPQILESEARHGATASYYFLVTDDHGRRRSRLSTRPYRIGHPLTRQAVSLVVEAGAEAGLHAFPNERTDTGAFRRRKQMLEDVSGRPCLGVRQHFLSMDLPATWQAQQHAGLLYDATLGWHNAVGFRAGTCMPYRVWDARAGRALNLWELPLTAMDGAMTHAWNEPANWPGRLEQFIQHVEKLGGCFSLLLHPNHFDTVDFPGERAFYETFMQEAGARKAWLSSGLQIVRHHAALRDGLRDGTAGA